MSSRAGRLRIGVGLGVLLLVVVALFVLVRPADRSAGAADAKPGATLGPLALGGSALREERDATSVAPGVEHIAIRRGHPSAGEAWTLTVGLGTSEAEVVELEQRVRAAGHTPWRSAANGSDPEGGTPLGHAVRVGRYASEAAAERAREDLAARGIRARVQHTAVDGAPTTGPWAVNVLVIDPDAFQGRLAAELATGTVPGRETVSALVRRTGAVAGVNGGFFVLGDRDRPGPWVAGTDGDPAGLSVVRGELISEAVGERPALVVPDGSGAGAAVLRLRTRLSVRADGDAREITGLNRQSGLVVNCGGAGDLAPLTRPAHDYTCGNPHELVLVEAPFGATAPEGAGHQVAVDGDGRVTAVRDSRGGPVPADGYLLQGTGDAATWLRDRAAVGTPLAVREEVVDVGTGRVLPMSAEASVINGGPLLLRDGALDLDPVRDGWSPRDIAGSDRAMFYNEWYLRRNARTAAGVTADGRLILMAADGDRPGHSVGLTIDETAHVMRDLGAVDAVNLDGGGSTTMVVEQRLRSRPSDAAGERPVGDALVVLP
jgi:hypothetical protein